MAVGIAKRLIRSMAVPLLAWGVVISPSLAADVLQCVPYARDLSGIRIHGDAWTWWEQAKGHYMRGNAPKPGAVIALANSDVMPLGHVAVVSHIVDDRHILLRHANWSGPGLIEEDVLAIDASAGNDWSQVRIWWGRGQQMGARINPVNGFIYPKQVNGKAMFDGGEAGRVARPVIVESRPRPFAKPALKPVLSASDVAASDVAATRVAAKKSGMPHLAIDPGLFRTGADLAVSSARKKRTLAMIVRDVKREARIL